MLGILMDLAMFVGYRRIPRQAKSHRGGQTSQQAAHACVDTEQPVPSGANRIVDFIDHLQHPFHGSECMRAAQLRPCSRSHKLARLSRPA